MDPEVPRTLRIQHVTMTGTALATALLPLVVGVLVAKSMGADPMTSVNALITSGGQRARVCPSQLRGCGRSALARWKGGAEREAADGTAGRLTSRLVSRCPWRG
ncbi:hypothetical protein V1460_15750 [Streptomyces sp. SCSIO 30461]|uniref:hypothetical protein n=1 Tax=Streptomyces sp. SCSIO 30461 TaxID=3118085 RepID=UPI0030D3BB52